MQHLPELLGKPEYVHVLLNHLPVTGLLVALVVLLAAVVMRRRAMILLGLALVAVFAASTYPVVYFGEGGYDRVYSMLYSEGQAWLEHHQHEAQRWAWLYYGTAVAGAAAFGLGLWKKKTLWAGVPIVALLALSSLVAGAYVSDLGGKVRHPEFRVGEPPAHEHESEETDGHDEPHEHTRLEHHPLAPLDGRRT